MRNLEWFNIPFLVVMLSRMWSDRALPGTWQRLTAYLLVAGLLAIGGWYWHIKIRELRDRANIDSELEALSRIDRIALLLLVGVTVAMIGTWKLQVGTGPDRVWATAFLVLAWAEYVNYFHFQLMYDNRADLQRLRRDRRLRRSHLATDLATRRAGKET